MALIFFLKEGLVYPFTPFLLLRRSFCHLVPFALVVCGSAVMISLEWGVGGFEFVGGGGGLLCRSAYLKRLIPAPSFHWGRCTLIQCAGTRGPRMQRWVARTKVIVVLILTYPHVFE